MSGTDRPRHIVHVVPWLMVGGLETFVITLASRQRAAGSRLTLLCQEELGPLAPGAQGLGLEVEHVSTRGNGAYVRNAPLTAWLSAWRPDVVHVHSFQWLKILPFARRAVPRARLVLTQHGLPPFRSPFGLLQMAVAARIADTVVAVSDEVATWQRTALRIDPAKIRVVRNGIDTDAYRPAPDAGEVRARYGIPRERKVIGLVARFVPLKNHAILVDAFVMLRRCVPDAHLVLVGDGELRDAVMAQVRANGLSDSVSLLGEVVGDPAIYRAFDLFVLASSTEGTSISLLEAMSSGVPVVATSVGGTPHVVREGRFGRLVAAGDASALSDAMVEALGEDPGLRAARAAAARSHVEDEFSMTSAVRRYEACYSGEHPS